MPHTDTSDVLDDGDHLREHGYVFLRGVFSQDECEQLASVVDDLVQFAETGAQDPFERYYMRHRPDHGVLYDLYQRHPAFRPFAERARILDVAATHLGDDILLYENSAIYKPRGARNEVPWHQDFINRPHEAKKLICWMALDDVTVDNGAIHAIPGSHKRGFLPFHQVPGETHHTRVNLDQVDVDQAVPLEMKRGDVLLFQQLLLHSSKRVSGDVPRRAYRVAYQGFDDIFAPRATPLVVRGGDGANLRRRFQQPRETPVAPRHRKRDFPKRVLRFVGRKLSELE